MKKIFLSLLAAAALTACSSDDNITGDIEQPAAEARTYTVSIAASLGDDDAQTRSNGGWNTGDDALTRAVTFGNDATPPTATGRFETSENIYVYNETTNAMLSGALHPSDISADGKRCQLTGTLTGTITAGDKLTLAYNMNTFYASYPTYSYFNYDDQNGTPTGVFDGGLSTSLTAVSLDGDGRLTTQETATFAMQQAILRLKFTDGSNDITVKTLLIESTGWDIAATYLPFKSDGNRYGQNQITVSPTTPTSDYLYVAVCINEGETPATLNFTVTDNDGNEYKGTKSAPSGGFKNGKYYYSSAAILLTKQAARIAPTITWTSVENDAAVSPQRRQLLWRLWPVEWQQLRPLRNHHQRHQQRLLVLYEQWRHHPPQRPHRHL